jgi:hypothetical protein
MLSIPTAYIDSLHLVCEYKNEDTVKTLYIVTPPTPDYIKMSQKQKNDLHQQIRNMKWNSWQLNGKALLFNVYIKGYIVELDCILSDSKLTVIILVCKNNIKFYKLTELKDTWREKITNFNLL